WEAGVGDGAALVGRDGLDTFDQRAVLAEIIAGKARMPSARVTSREIGKIGHDAGQQAAPERRISDERDAEIARDLAGVDANLRIEQRIFALHPPDGVHRLRAADALWLGLAKPEMPDLALLDEFRHRADRVLDRHIRVDAVLEIDVDVIHAEALEARLAGLHHIFRPAIDAVLPTGVLGLAEF